MSQLPNLMDQMSKTFAGKLENLKDTFRQELGDIGKPLFEELSKAVDQGAKALESPAFKQAAADMVKDLTTITKAVEAVTGAFSKLSSQDVKSFESGGLPTVGLGQWTRRALSGFGMPGMPGTDTRPAPDQSAAGDFGPPAGGGAAFLAQQVNTSGVISHLTDQVRTGALTADQARQQWRALAETFGGLYTNAGKLSDVFNSDLNQAIEDHTAQVDAATAAHEKFADTLKQAGQAQAVGASAEDIRRGVFGVTSTGAQATPEQIQRAKQDINDLTTAWQRAASVVGTVDLSHGLAGFAAVAPDLAKARDSLRDLGQSNQALDNLASLSAQFKSLTDATDAATTAYRGFMLTLTETDQKIQQLTTFRGQVTGAVSDADRRRSLGIATPEDLQLLANYKNILANIDQMKGGLQQHATGDILGIAANYPDLKKADDTLRDMIGKVGGPQQLVIDVKTNTDKAIEQINDLLSKPHQATIDVQIATHLTGLPPWLATVVANATGVAPAAGASTTAASDGGYARPTTIRSTGGGPYGNDSLQQGGAGGGGWNQFQSLSQAQYSSIVSSGPLANPQVYAGVMAAAQEYNVDPRALLAFVKNEGVAPSLAAVNNFGGIKGSGGPVSTEGDTYAAYSSPTDFFRSLAANLTTGAYAGDYQSGNLAAVRQRYVAGSAAPSAAQQANIANTVSYYGDLSQQYPAASGTHDAVASTVRDQIVQKALADVDQDKLAGYCEQWVEETVQAITGKRGATGKNELSANAAFASAQKQGLVTTDPQPGDLVYYGDATNGHVAIYMGGGKQVSTADVGGSRIHTESVGKGAQYVSIGAAGGTSGLSPELAAALGIHSGAQSYLAAAGGGTTNLTGPATASGGVAAGIRSGIAGVQGTQLGQTLAGLDPRDAQSALATYQQFLPIFQQIANTKFPDTPIRAADEALQQGVGFLGAWAQGLQAIRGQTDGLAAAQQRITETIGGPLATNLNAQLDHMNALAQANTRINDLTQRRTELEKQHADVVAQRQQQDQADSRTQQRAQFAQADADRARQQQRTVAQQGIQDQQRAENTAFTQVSRANDDRQRALTQQQALAARGLGHQLEDAQTAARTTDAAGTARQQLLEAGAAAATTPGAKVQASEQAAIETEFNQRRREQSASAIDDLQRQIEKQAEVSSDALYDLETERIAAQRAHEDRMANLQDQSDALQRTYAEQDAAIADQRAAQQEADFEHRAGIEDQRAAQDAMFTTATASIDAEIAKYQELATAEQQALASLQQAFNLMAQGSDAIGASLTAALTTATKAQSLLNATSLANYPTTGAIRRLAGGGMIPVGGTAIVGDANGGGITRYSEHVTVTPAGAIVTPIGGGGDSGGGAVTINLGGLTVTSGDRQAIIRETLDQVAAMLNAAFDAAARGDTAHKAATGGIRTIA
jgi:hypothetical protein